MSISRITAHDAQEHLRSQPGALLVCAYDSREKFHQNHLEGAISLEEFRSRVPTLDKNREVIFYCA